MVLREKNILASLPTSAFVVTLYNAFQCPQVGLGFGLGLGLGLGLALVVTPVQRLPVPAG